MKNLNALLIVAGVFCMQHAMAQTKSHLTLSTDYPEVEKKVSFTYDSAGTAVAGQKDMSAIVYFFDNKLYPAKDVSLTPSGKAFKGVLEIPASAKAFLIKIVAGDKTDNNNGAGYIYQVFKGKQPVPGAYAMQGFILAGTGNNISGVKQDMKKSLDLYKKEFELHPDIEKDYASPYYYYLFRVPEYKTLADNKLNGLKKSSNEKDLLLAVDLLNATKQTTIADSLKAAISTNFPNGTGARNNLIVAVMKEKNPAIKEELYKAYKVKYATGDEENDERLKTRLAEAYLFNGKLDDFRRVEATLKSKQDLILPLNDVAYDLAKKGERLTDAEELSRQSLDMVRPLIEKPQVMSFIAPSQVQRNNKVYNAMFEDTYAYILFRQNKFNEALPHEEAARAGGRGETETYVLILDALGKTDEVIKVAGESVKSGWTTDVIKEKLKKNYIAKNGTDSYDKFLTDLLKQAREEARTKLAASMINKPAPDFELKDLDGNPVSLKSLKGKTVVVDFWATWCGPCKASFPGMQMAVNKYKDDPNIKFLFVDTWETGADYITGVKKFIADNKYTFHVLVDEKNDAGKQAKVVNDFGVTGIPTKFLIDKNGNIRFKYVGYSGSSDKVADEVSDMLELTQTAGEKTAGTKPETKEKSK
ncbi:TlpA disulfide reductase family protein [Mucilaginibacter sp. UR6-11]|uniref:TlpA family protein disulfide reductase n=1 Tax=Mucilaginibacter sp. UR6-11 TaxID=1435644 RepID=UPI001E4D3B4C|nr:TlpA disulfide reductase family protein [Mucilaginibacter sp. UR6-11]MCC8425964.1 redoxin domain-containing protein [Mucilaginibacter sp. UR6-11]